MNKPLKVRLKSDHKENCDYFLIPKEEILHDKKDIIPKITGTNKSTITKGMGIDGSGNYLVVVEINRETGEKNIRTFEGESKFEIIED